MTFDSFVEGPLLLVVLLIFIIGIAFRITLFVYTILRSSENKNCRWMHFVSTLGRLSLPFHKAVVKRPFYFIPRCIFHVCLIIVPIGLSAHIAMWEEYLFGFDWIALPDELADWMTLLILGLTLYFLLRRLSFEGPRLSSSKSDFLLVIITTLPFLTGFFLTHGTLDAVFFFENSMRIMHVVCGEAMLIAVVFLFLRTKLDVGKCMGCVACELSCPTAALNSCDEKNLRIFTYSDPHCIGCGACVITCPKEAAELRHEFSFRRFFQLPPKERISSVELEVCERCNTPFAPVPQLDEIGQTIAHDYLRFCPRCRRANIAETLYQLIPLSNKLGKQ